MTLLVTGGAGFIGSNFILQWIDLVGEQVVNLDRLTYAGNIHNLDSLKDDRRHILVHDDIANSAVVRALFNDYRPRAVVHFAAESHVDRSIQGPAEFIDTNIVGTFRLLEEAMAFWDSLASVDRDTFRFLHVSTDEVYGSLSPDDPPFSEATAYAPNSPYSASKAASDHLVRAYHHTYGLPVLTSNCSNNYGPYQFPEKLIPLVILNALSGEKLPVYGNGLNVRDWLYVEDHCSAIRKILLSGRPGETYNVGGRSEMTNIEVVLSLCKILDELRPDSPFIPHADLITYVDDRPGHDLRYAIDARKIEREIGWTPSMTFEGGLKKTVQWYLANEDWISGVTSGQYRDWIESNYGQRSKSP